MIIRKNPSGDTFRKCDKCGYDRGFHSSLEREVETHRAVLICPECGTMYDVDWKANLENV